jgi:hypothetical protein
MKARTAVVVCALAAAPMCTPPPAARADDQSYLAALDEQGAFVESPLPSRVAAGHRFCSELRGGSSPDDIEARYQNITSFGGWGAIDDLRKNLRTVIETAQRELCPDTLG